MISDVFKHKGNKLLCEDMCKQASERASSFLVGAQLDRFIVFSIELQICLISGANNSEIWISSTSDGYIHRKPQDDFFVGRRELISDLHELIGKEVTNVSILPSGQLILSFQRENLVFSAKRDDYSEYSWAIRSENPAPYTKHQFEVLLSENNNLIIREA